MKVLFCAEGGAGLPPSVQMLHADRACEAILEGLPECDRWGIIHKGIGDVGCPNPFREESKQSQLNLDGATEEGDDCDGEGSLSAPPARAVPPIAGRKRGPPSSGDMEPYERPKKGCHPAVITMRM